MDTAPGNVATENMSTNSAYALTHMKVKVLADVCKSAGKPCQLICPEVPGNHACWFVQKCGGRGGGAKVMGELCLLKCRVQLKFLCSFGIKCGHR